MASALITGVAGYIGRRLAAALLERGDTVRGIDRDIAGLRSLVGLGVKAIVADVTDGAILRAALAGVDVIYHLAGSALGSRAEIVLANVGGAREVADACLGRRDLRAVVFASSGALYPSSTGWLDEETPPAPAFAYAKAKHEAEQVLLDAHARHGLPVRIARIAAVYGPESPALMLPLVRRGRFPLIGGGAGVASSIHIDDLIPALIAVAEAGRDGQIYNLADDEPASVRDFYGRLAELAGGPRPPSLPAPLARALVGMANGVARLRGQPAPLPADLVAMAGVSHRMANRRMRAELGVELRHPSYREGLATVLEPAPGDM